MWKKTLLAVFLASQYTFAAGAEKEPLKSYTETELKQLKNDWLVIYQKELQHAENLRLKQRENFQQINYLVDVAVSQKNLSPATEQVIQRLLATLSGYPLEMEAEWKLLNAKMTLKQATEQEVKAFVAKYPESLYQRQLQNFLFEQLYREQKFEELVEYAKSVKPTQLAEQCRVFSAHYEIAASKAQINPMVEQKVENAELSALVKEFDDFWLANPKLTSDCANLESFWRDQGLKTDEKVRLKVVELVKQNANAEIANLALNATDENLKTWLSSVEKVSANPKDLQNFIENQPLDSAFKSENKAIIIELLPKYIRNQPEKLDNPTFEQYQVWAEKYQFSEDEFKALKTAFISRHFDNEEPTFQFWRDEQIKGLGADNLLERRLRMAIWQRSDLNEWLASLSSEAKNKAEWRYWSAKIEKNEAKRKTIFEELAKERGFYPMLAAQQLGMAYQFPIIEVADLTQAQRELYEKQFERIQELRELGQIDQAKRVWINLINNVKTETGESSPVKTQLAIIQYAKEQNWYDLAVEGTIQIKAFDNIDLRLPNAYSDWFELNLQDKKISKSFAQAIARQESAWNPQAQSHTNARGIMQMLPTTAEKTAKDNGLQFRGERDLFRPFNNIMLGTTHLMELNEKYPNNRILISSAYNAGAGRVEQWLKRSNGTLEMDEFIASIPFYETRGYVQNVLAYDYYYQMLYGNVGEKSKNELKMFYQEELGRKY
ncbi:soluble lytic murein transglycosylase [Mannheimia sp. USDA-ARS-USMARC-1261]|uniref:transglycosylase SLT domain-containing protein n=1 Tax=Mannheimia sp. USDA-ARS-USMARC-1261 TaxID=1432056 RepID=UPI0003E3959D|nr:transglycosylase SLT domain-containing protein [Mannheimia sp. USDA-ARS-USMARC-1261]AHG73533.1 soluble lytic murein transglycosylase [Mannheimia sp. USDA-ARS-USMARC-1261]